MCVISETFRIVGETLLSFFTRGFGISWGLTDRVFLFVTRKFQLLNYDATLCLIPFDHNLRPHRSNYCFCWDSISRWFFAYLHSDYVQALRGHWRIPDKVGRQLSDTTARYHLATFLLWWRRKAAASNYSAHCLLTFEPNFLRTLRGVACSLSLLAFPLWILYSQIGCFLFIEFVPNTISDAFWFFNLRLRSDDKAAFQLLRVCVELGHVGSRILIIFKYLLSGYCLLWVEWRWGRFDFRLLRHASLSLDSGNMRQTSTLDFHFKWSELGWPKRTCSCYHATVEPKNTGQMCKFCCQIAVGLHPTLFSALSHSSVLCSGVVTVAGWSQKCAFEFLLIKSVGVVQMERTQLPI